ncbi:bifunctional tetrahydrofolate synthase/dihydrofolate synthase [Burkholderia multivorans]|uniref:bifunctional tetrahydrofolate synthase/dihydrofolate synthase n=1 Tax=Burkholderia multivorans TaxID=87883 RepID=UPI000CFFE992|nr:bifunctional tetrahydrofolate synthase/dihydrofolate synthase [Burkholderia multivorans]MBJ9619476.1 bifunctional tetrahydrofolate synthase/dihydrofolate synthase [Burkholderia multivorans]MBU9327009.1 bifunctional tetrahydrofolate synthase/dihydrofolate synthase [Burkholderia multivorans]MBU9529209.1 bifunctional tetrahydrofolate synthase/dihydrofolate synthase [Burkholderia multivorans]MDR8787547.1 Dihydrofolate synthase/folylpolyglutamate synthase [Burkholderia multivorans]MDR8828442.1 D
MSTFPTLDAWLSHLERAHPVGIDMGLTRIGQVKAALQLEFACPVITVGGTNGKGSTCAFLETILVRAGYKVGCHTSPHLLEFNERARVNGEVVGDAELLPHFEAVEAARTSLPEPVSLTYFEFTTLAILHLFASRGLDAVILEVGLGGRLDAVNIIDTDCAIVTSIDIDHTEYLGDTREKIAFEKAGIFRPGKPAICGDPAAPQTLVDHAAAIGADLWLVGRDFRYEAQPGAERQQWSYIGRDKRYPALAYPALRGANQLINASAALAALEALRPQLPVSAQDIRLGLANVELPGRFQVLPGKPAIVLDVAHNPHAAAVLEQNLGNMGFFPYTYAVFGAMHDKDIDGVLRHLKGEIDHWCVTDLPLPRAASAEQLEAALRKAGVHDGPDSSVTRYASPADAFSDALKRASENDRIVVFGSFHTVAGVMAYRKSQQH